MWPSILIVLKINVTESNCSLALLDGEFAQQASADRIAATSCGGALLI
jgi:hypothetical protein